MALYFGYSYNASGNTIVLYVNLNSIISVNSTVNAHYTYLHELNQYHAGYNMYVA